MCNFYIKRAKRNCKINGKYNGFCKRHMAKQEPCENKQEDSCSEECSICLCDIKCKKKMADTSCGHTFHKTCLNAWIKQNNTCPYCRKSNPLNKPHDFVSQVERNVANVNLIQEALQEAIQMLQRLERERDEMN